MREINKGSKKFAPVDMKKEAYQFVIDGTHIDEVLKQIPSTLKIIGAKLLCVKGTKTSHCIVPNALKKFGVDRMRVREASHEISWVFDETTKSIIKENVEKTIKNQKLDINRVIFSYVVLQNSEAVGKFCRTSKEINPDETDLRKKLHVLGLTSGKGKISTLIQDLGAKKYKCEIKETTARLLICSKA